MPSDPPSGPLAGLLVADCSTVLAGPYCTMLLADLGADVVKVEPPEGDGTRIWGPPWIGAGLSGPDDPGTAAYYLAINRNKRSLRLDLKRPAGAAVLRRLLARADVLVENFRVGGFDRLGFSEADLERINPRLVHLAISGYGPDGPDADKPGYDFVLQAVGGLMSITGFPDGEDGHPSKVGVAISDVATGMLAAVAILGALLGRDRAGGAGASVGGGGSGAREASDTSGGGLGQRIDVSDTSGAGLGQRIDPSAASGAGLGQRIDVSLLESTLAILVNQAQNAFATGMSPGRRGNAHPNIVPYETFATADGEIAVAVGSERQWRRFCDALELAGLTDDPRFATNGDRVRNRADLRPLLADRLAAHPTGTWLERLEAAEIPCGPINDILTAFEQPQARARGMNASVEHPRLGRIRQAGIPFKLSRTPATIRSAPPLLGEHTDELLRELGYDDGAIAALRAEGVV